jgi:hypothetical protein
VSNDPGTKERDIPPAVQKLSEYKAANNYSVSEIARQLGRLVDEESPEDVVQQSTVHRWFSGSIPDAAHQVLIERLIPGITREDWLTQKDRARLRLSERERVETDRDGPPSDPHDSDAENTAVDIDAETLIGSAKPSKRQRNDSPPKGIG